MERFRAAGRPRGVLVDRVEWTVEVGSTNDALADRIASDPGSVPDRTVLGTDFQSGGHGRLGRTWTSPPGTCLTSSTALRVPAGFPVDRLGWMPVVAGLCVAEALAGCGVDSGIKWPNDVLVDGRKICGILVRACPTPDGLVLVAGIGINVALSEAELPVPTATSLAMLGHDVAREDLLAVLLERLGAAADDVFAAGADVHLSGTAARVRESMVTLGSEVRVELPGGELVTGEAHALDELANLLVRTERGERRVSAGDVIHARQV